MNLEEFKKCCVKQTERGLEFMPRLFALFEDIIEENRPETMLLLGRGSGKSSIGAMCIIHWSQTRGLGAVISNSTFQAKRGILNRVLMMCSILGIECVRTKDGIKIRGQDVLAASPESLLGLELKYAAIDEANYFKI